VTRTFVPERLDQLPAEHPTAVHSRRDLRRINWFMQNARSIACAMRQSRPKPPPQHLVDLGGGDGAMLLALERRLAHHWPDLTVTLVDQVAVSPRFTCLCWRTEFLRVDADAWLATLPPGSLDVLMTNLFLHHFPDDKLRLLLEAIARVTRLFVACEPRRSQLALFGCCLLPILGCNHVTRHDARVSVRAGFAGQELSVCWPSGGAWELAERPAGLFGHLFVARRCD
jgi:hypothetical protein